MPTNYFKCNNCNIKTDKIYHRFDQVIVCEKCNEEMVKMYIDLNTSLLNNDDKNESISSSLQNNKKELEKFKNKEK